MKNICIFDNQLKYAYIIKSFLLTFQCRVTISKDETDACNKLSIGVYDGLILIESFPESLQNVVTNLYENSIVTLYIGNIKKEKIKTRYSINEPFSLLDFAKLIKNFVSDIRKCDCLYYVVAKKDNQVLNCILENPTKEGGVLYPNSYTIYNINTFNNFFKDKKEEFEINFLQANEKDTLLAKPLHYEYRADQIIKEVFIRFILSKKEERKMFI
ncbi:MAG: hypothetical protein ACK4NF_02770 [Planctomycetota bacterium]